MNDCMSGYGTLGFNNGLGQVGGYGNQTNPISNKEILRQMAQAQMQPQANYFNSTPSPAKPTDDRLLVLLTED